jgi:hypothetical protein
MPLQENTRRCSSIPQYGIYGKYIILSIYFSSSYLLTSPFKLKVEDSGILSLQ